MKRRSFFRPPEKQIYIIPNTLGMMCFACTVLVFMTGFVFGNTTLYFFGFALTTFFVTAMVQTNNNLRGLSVQFTKFEPCHAGGQVVCLVALKNDFSVNRYQLRLRISSANKEKSDVVLDNCAALQAISERTAFKGLKRGVFKAPRLQISSQYPLGLFFSWKVHRSAMHYLVYPRPEGSLPLPETYTDLSTLEDSGSHLQGNEDFSGLHIYTPADAPGRIAWNTLARGMPLSAKSFESGFTSARILDYEGLALSQVESRLSQLAVWVLMCEESGESYELRMPLGALGPGSGREFAHECLRLLALYEQPLPPAQGLVL